MEPYDPKAIEKKWQDYWQNHNVYHTENNADLPKYYVLDMFPYPSGAGLHVGHPRGYMGSDVFARFKKMKGFNVLHPMGFDSFGLPAEQYAISTGNHPGPHTEELIVRFREQLQMMGMSYDWDRVVATHRPDYYRWTQWIFLRLYDHYYDLHTNKAQSIASLTAYFAKHGNVDTAAYTNQSVGQFTAAQWNSYTPIEQQAILMNYRIAYEGYADVNWCPELGTVLANDEVLTDSDGRLVSERGGHPVERKRMRQWFMRITAYADRLLDGLDGLDWNEHIKTIQRNWIGKSEGAEIQFQLQSSAGDNLGAMTVFTTRADTLFGVTYVVLAPEHSLVTSLIESVTNRQEVVDYIKWVESRGEDDRIASKEKTGVALQGVVAINPANGESVPVWIADYVLASYGTGAVMAVPAHDERDFEFAQKYKLPVKQVIEPTFIDLTKNIFLPNEPISKTNGIVVILKDNSQNKYLGIKWKKVKWETFLTGGIEDGETAEGAALREIKEETGYKNVKIVSELSPFHSFFYHHAKKINKHLRAKVFYCELINDERDDVSSDESENHDLVWLSKDELSKFDLPEAHKYSWSTLVSGAIFTDYGMLINSGNFNGENSEDAIQEIIKLAGGKTVTKYKMRDAIFARQRYWGEPIPLRHDLDGIITPLADSQLPLELPDVQSYQPTGNGESPLASVTAWVDAGYETNTMPGWAGSSWYWLRYMDPQNDQALVSGPASHYWQNVDMYVGGSEHATGHLLYSRFWNKFLYDIGIAPTDEPFAAMRNQGMILAADGRKMSKRWGNTVTPDEMIERFGADSFRLYECFIGPFDASQPWIIDGVVGCRRFVERVWRQTAKCAPNATTPEALQKSLHKTIKKVGEDIEQFKFNTAVAAMMELVNEMDRVECISVNDFVSLLRILAPFAPHVTEELFQELKSSETVSLDSSITSQISLHLMPWPDYDPALIVDNEITIAIQVNGKSRGIVTVPAVATESEILEAVRATDTYVRWVGDAPVQKTVYVPGKIMSIIT